MTRFLRCDPRYPEGTPPDVLLTRTIYSGVSFVVFPELWPFFGHCLEMGLNVAPVIAQESGNPEQYFDWATSEWMIPRVIWTIGNEPTSTGESSWTMDAPTYTAFWNSCRGLNGKRYVAGMADGDPERARPYLQPDADGLSIHIYTLPPADARLRVRAYQALGVKVRVGETSPVFGRKLADYAWPAGVDVTDFCYSNRMVPGYGLFA